METLLRTGHFSVSPLKLKSQFQLSVEQEASSLAASFRGVRVAGPQDNAEILSFINQKSMELKGLSIRYDRSPDFFRFLELQGDFSIVYLQRDDEGQIQAVGSFVYRKVLVEGDERWVGYIADLRVSAYRLGRVQWRKIYERQLEVAESLNVLGHYTVILDDNDRGRTTLVSKGTRPDKSRFKYLPLRCYRMVSVVGRMPFSQKCIVLKDLSPLRPRPAFDVSLEIVEMERVAPQGDLISFLRSSPTSSWQEPMDLKNLSRFESKFLVARNSAGRILGACLPWSPGSHKSVVVESWPSQLQLLRKFLNFALERAGKVEKKVPDEGGKLEFLYLTQLRWSSEIRPDDKIVVLEKFIQAAQDSCVFGPCHFVAFQEERMDQSLRKKSHSRARDSLARFFNSAFPMSQALKNRGWFIQNTNATLYSVEIEAAAEPRQDIQSTSPAASKVKEELSEMLGPDPFPFEIALI